MQLERGPRPRTLGVGCCCSTGSSLIRTFDNWSLGASEVLEEGCGGGVVSGAAVAGFRWSTVRCTGSWGAADVSMDDMR